MAVLENTGEDAEQQAALLGNQIHKSKTGIHEFNFNTIFAMNFRNNSLE